MWKVIATLLAAIVLGGCGQDYNHKGKVYPTYGFLNAHDLESHQMCYKVIWGNVIWSIILSETIAMPIYFVGFSIFEVDRPKTESKSCGIDDK